MSGLLQLLGICTGFAAMIGIESVGRIQQILLRFYSKYHLCLSQLPSRRRTSLGPCECADLPWRPYTRGWSPAEQCSGVTVQGLLSQARFLILHKIIVGLLKGQLFWTEIKTISWYFFRQGGELPLVSHRQPSAPHHHQGGQGFIARESSVINGDIRLHKEKLLDGTEIKSYNKV